MKGLLFDRDGDRATHIGIPTIMHTSLNTRDGSRFPAVEAILGSDAKMHESWVTCGEEGNAHHFLVVAQFRPECVVNEGLQAIWPESFWRGDLIVMRGGRLAFVVDIGGRYHQDLAQEAVRR